MSGPGPRCLERGIRGIRGYAATFPVHVVGAGEHTQGGLLGVFLWVQGWMKGALDPFGMGAEGMQVGDEGVEGSGSRGGSGWERFQGVGGGGARFGGWEGGVGCTV